MEASMIYKYGTCIVFIVVGKAQKVSSNWEYRYL